MYGELLHYFLSIPALFSVALQLGKGPGPVAHTSFPSSHQHYPSVAFDPHVKENQVCLPMIASTSSYIDTSAPEPAVLSKIIPIVDSIEWVKKLLSIPGITDIQLRLKGKNQEEIKSTVREAQELVKSSAGGLTRLWINDYWKEAISAKCFGVHLGQEDLASCIEQGGIEILQKLKMALGVSSHTYAELSVALSVKPSYISLGPVFGTTSKDVKFGPQGLTNVVSIINV
jgi:thiamine-phosphate diphosphorylase